MLHPSKMGSELECKKLWRLSNAVCFDVDSTVCEVVQLTTCDFFKTSKHVIPVRAMFVACIFGYLVFGVKSSFQGTAVVTNFSMLYFVLLVL